MDVACEDSARTEIPISTDPGNSEVVVSEDSIVPDTSNIELSS